MFNYFEYEHFDSPDVQGSGQMMDLKIIQMLDKARAMYGKPIYITSGYRTEAHNEKVGGVSGSSHLKGLAADVSDNAFGTKIDSRNRFLMLQALFAIGFGDSDEEEKDEKMVSIANSMSDTLLRGLGFGGVLCRCRVRRLLLLLLRL